MSQDGGNTRSTRQNPSLQTPSNEPERQLRQRQRGHESNETPAPEATSSTPLPGQPVEDQDDASPTRNPSGNTPSTSPSLQPRQLHLVTPRNGQGVQNAPSASTAPTEELDVTRALTRHTTFHTASQSVGPDVRGILQQASIDIGQLTNSELDTLPTAFETLIQTPPDTATSPHSQGQNLTSQSTRDTQQTYGPPPSLPVRHTPTDTPPQSQGASNYGTPKSDLQPAEKMAAVLEKLIADTASLAGQIE